MPKVWSYTIPKNQTLDVSLGNQKEILHITQVGLVNPDNLTEERAFLYAEIESVQLDLLDKVEKDSIEYNLTLASFTKSSEHIKNIDIRFKYSDIVFLTAKGSDIFVNGYTQMY